LPVTLFEWRINNNWTQRRFAHMLGVTERTYRSWEKGERTPHGCHIKAIWEVTGGQVTIDDLEVV
jgi:DNA-binding transcriptional regulator YiaG